MREPIRIRKNGVDDFGDLVKIARVEGRKKLGVKSVRVLPVLLEGPESYIVLVEPKSSSGDVAGERSDSRSQSDEGAPDVQARDVAGLEQETGDP